MEEFTAGQCVLLGLSGYSFKSWKMFFTKQEMCLTFVNTTWTKYAKILKSGDYFSVSPGSIASFSLWEFVDSLHNLTIQNLGLGKQKTTVVTGSQNNLGVTWCWSNKTRVLRASHTAHFLLKYLPSI